MNPRIRKEIRSLLPSFSVTIAATILIALTFDGSDAWSMVSFVFGGGCVMMGACSFGNEFYTRTMTSLLAQPISRRQIWVEKLQVLGGALALAYLAWLFSVAVLVRGEGRPENFTEVPLTILLIPIIVFCSAPFISLLAKNIMGSMALTAMLPFAAWLIILAADYFLSRLLVLFGGSRLLAGNELLLAGSFDKYSGYYIAGLALAYSVLLHREGWTSFAKFESLDSSGTEVKLPAQLEERLSPLIKRLTPGYTRPFASLVRKELGLQRLNFIMAGLLCAYLPFAAVAWALHPSELTNVLLIAPFSLYVLLVPLLTGILCMAEERNLGTVNWQFTLPPAGAMQWRAKMLVTLGTCLGLGGLLPLLLAGAWAVVAGEKLGNPFNEEGSLLCLCYLFLFSLVVFASSISSNSMRAIIAALGIVCGVGAVVALAGYGFSKLMMAHHLFVAHFYSLTEKKWMAVLASQNPANDPTMKHQAVITVEIIRALSWGGVVLMLALLTLWFFRMASSNFRSGELNPRRSWTQMSWIFAVVGALAIVVQGLVFVVNQLGDVPR